MICCGGEMKGDDLASGLGDIDAGREVRWTRRDKALYAQHGAGPKLTLRTYIAGLLTETRQLNHSMTSALEVAVDRN